ncbi:MAG: CBS domain-containing protein [Bacillota bacterium]
MRVKEIMTTDVRTVKPNDTIMTAASLMDQIDVGCIPVIDNNNLVGIVTDRDIVVRSVSKGQSPNQHVSDVMTTDVTYVSPDTDIHEVADIMAEQQIRRLPVVENKSLVGIVSIGDLAVEDIFENEAGEALHDISFGVRH